MAIRAKDDLATPLCDLLAKYHTEAGSTSHGAIRDCLTELMHICQDSHSIDFDERLEAAREVYREEMNEKGLCPACGQPMSAQMVPDTVGKGLTENFGCSNPGCEECL